MRFILVLLMCLSLGACALTPAPEPIKEGTALAAQLADINYQNLQNVNEQYYTGFKNISLKLLEKERAKPSPDPETIALHEKHLEALEQLHKRIAEIGYPVGSLQVDLTAALAEWAAEPGIELSRLLSIVTNGAILLQKQP